MTVSVRNMTIIVQNMTLIVININIFAINCNTFVPNLFKFVHNMNAFVLSLRILVSDLFIFVPNVNINQLASSKQFRSFGFSKDFIIRGCQEDCFIRSVGSLDIGKMSYVCMCVCMLPSLPYQPRLP